MRLKATSSPRGPYVNTIIRRIPPLSRDKSCFYRQILIKTNGQVNQPLPPPSPSPSPQYPYRVRTSTGQGKNPALQHFPIYAHTRATMSSFDRSDRREAREGTRPAGGQACKEGIGDCN